MADTTIEIDGLTTGWTVYTQIQTAAGLFWNGTAYVTYSVGDWASYATATPETGSTGTYVCQFPTSSPAGFYAWTMFRQIGATPASTDPAVSFTSPDTYWNGDEFSTAAPANPSPVDLIASAYAEQVLAAGGVTLTGAQAAILPTLITAASREIIRYCSRQFALTTYSEIVTPEGTRQDRGEPASAAGGADRLAARNPGSGWLGPAQRRGRVRSRRDLVRQRPGRSHWPDHRRGRLDVRAYRRCGSPLSVDFLRQRALGPPLL